MGADIPNSEPMRSAYVTLTVDREEDAERIYSLLANGGEIFMKMEKTPFANRFAMLRDRTSFAGSSTQLNKMVPILTSVVGVPLFEAVRISKRQPTAPERDNQRVWIA